jgi:hypothetical protein
MDPRRAALGVLRTTILRIFPQRVDGMRFMHEATLLSTVLVRLPSVVT